MTLPVEINPLLLSQTSGYTVGRSLRFRSSASAYLNRTFGTPTNNKIWTWSGWVKRGPSGSRQFLSSTNTTGGSNAFYFEYDSSDAINIGDYGASWTWRLTTTQVFRDFSAWYHLVLSVDTTQATASNRVKLYVNGVQVTAFSTATYPSQNSNPYWNSATYSNIGNLNGTSLYFDGYLAEVNFIDGQALTPSSFGATDVNGVWQPKKYTGTYGTNGFYLNFSDNSAATAAAIGKDSSGNGNNWTPNNISVTAGTTYDSMVDSPTVSASSSNYAVLNPLQQSSGITLSNANLTAYSNAQGNCVRGTIAISSGKWYWEAVQTAQGSGATNNCINGIMLFNEANNQIGVSSTSYGYVDNGNKVNNNTQTAYGATYGLNDVMGIALDLDGGTITFYKNNVSQGTAFTGLSGTFMPAIGDRGGGVSKEPTWAINFGQRPFTYTPPTGFKALNTYNLPAPTILAGNAHFDATTYTGTAAIKSVTNSGSFQPDLLWIKDRTNAYAANIQDVIRGSHQVLIPSLTNAEASSSTLNGVTSFNSNGFSLGLDTNTVGSVNALNDAYVAWQWKGGGAGVSNTAGSITSTVSANPSAGFSIVTYTGTGTGSPTIGHGLGVAPSMIIVKSRSNAVNWGVGHVSAGWANAGLLNGTNAFGGSTYFASTAPTSTVFSVQDATVTNISGATYVAYCFAAVRGFSAFGSYAGTNTSDGPFVYTGFRPRWIMVKAITTQYTTTDWAIVDTARETYNINRSLLRANTSAAEDTSAVADIDILSNGFKLRYSPNETNGPNTYIYAAFAENPFNSSRAR